MARNRNAGVTLIELLVAVAIVGMVSLAVGTLFMTIFTSYRNVTSILDLTRESQKAAYGWPPGEGIFEHILQASTVESTAADGLALNLSGDTVSYFVTNEQLVCQTATSRDTVARQVSDIACTYYGLNSSGKIIAESDTADVGLVQVALEFSDNERSYTNIITGRLRNR